MNIEEYSLLKKKVRDLIKFDLDNYNTNQMMRRLSGFIERSNLSSVSKYCVLLEEDVNEQARLSDFLTINVSEFFRDREHFEELKGKILPELLKNSIKLNIWSAGCSCGAEAYSVAILLDQLSRLARHKILGTDIDIASLDRAKAGGPYSAADVRNVPHDILSVYFKFSNGKYWVIDKIRETVEFRRKDLLLDSCETGFDLIICRNVIIYFSDDAKRKLRETFVKSLKDRGVLFIGATETMLDAEAVGFERMSSSFFRKNRGTAAAGLANRFDARPVANAGMIK